MNETPQPGLQARKLVVLETSGLMTQLAGPTEQR